MINAILDPARKAFNVKTVINHSAKPRITARSCHGTGKTTAMAAIAHIWTFIFANVRVVATAPKQDQLLRRLMPRYRDILRSAPSAYQNIVEVMGRDVYIAGAKDWGLSLETASDPDSLAGFHDEPQLILVDEASSKKLDPLFQVLEGALTTKGSVIAEIGNPTRMSGEFYQHHNRKDLDNLYYRMHIKHTDAGELISNNWIESMRIKYGEESPIFKIRVGGDFADFDEATLTPLELIEEAYDSDLEDDGSIPKLLISVDVMDGGEDSTVITAAKKYDTYMDALEQSCHRYKASKSPIESAKQAIRVFHKFGGRKDEDYFIVDANGCGAGCAGYLMEKGYIVVRHVGGESSNDPTRYRNRRVQNYITCSEFFQNGKVKIDKDKFEDIEQFEMEMVTVKRKPGDDSKIDDIQTAEEVKKDLNGVSPDKASSFTMLFHGELPETHTAPSGDTYIVQSALINEYF